MGDRERYKISNWTGCRSFGASDKEWKREREDDFTTLPAAHSTERIVQVVVKFQSTSRRAGDEAPKRGAVELVANLQLVQLLAYLQPRGVLTGDLLPVPPKMQKPSSATSFKGEGMFLQLSTGEQHQQRL